MYYKLQKNKNNNKTHFFYTHLRSSGLPGNDAKTLFPHRLSLLISPVILANATVVASALLRSSRFNFHCYSANQRLLRNRPGNGSSDLSRLLTRKITKGIHSCKPVSLHCPYLPLSPPPGLSVPASTSPETTRR